MSLYITSNFIESLLKLDKKLQKYTLAAIHDLEYKQQNESLKIHKIENCRCDHTFRSARVNDDVRIVFSNRGNNNKLLLYVDHHEDAYRWCEGKYIERTAFGAEMIFDEKQVLNTVEKFSRENEEHNMYIQTAPLLESHSIKAKHLEKLGIPQIHANNLLSISSVDEYLDYIQIFSEELQEALLSLATSEKSFDEIYNELVDDDFSNGAADEHRDNKRRFYMLQSLDELEKLLDSNDFEKWTIFLHPSQDKLVRMNLNGPALIEGGPGTGKTVVGIHRALYLSKTYFNSPNSRILFCTFSKKLSLSIQSKLKLLATQKGISTSNIDVASVDSYMYKLYQNAYHRRPSLDDAAIRGLLEETYNRLRPKSGSLKFYQYEYYEVIEKKHITTLEQYLKANRTGGQIPLTEKQRVTAWKFFDAFLSEKEANGYMSFVDMAHAVYAAMENGTLSKIYDSIIIDEAQDLEPIKIRVIANSARASKNNVFILSDMNQRIFKLSSWKNDGGVSIVGRTKYLSINYRTTKQISDYALYQFVETDVVTDHIKEYKSVVNGEPPKVEPFKNDFDQKRYIVKAVQDILTRCPEEQICVICPNTYDCVGIKSVLEYEKIRVNLLDKDTLPEPNKGVCVCPARGVKGLEFRVVIIYNYNNIESYNMSTGGESLLLHTYKKLAECAKYVASTRARDELIITYVDQEDNNDSSY